jgi:hypothetical protein
MDDQHIDGNGIADVVGEVAGAEMSAVLRTCQSCGDRRAIGEPRPYRSVGELRLYRSVGVVLRCPACEDVGVVLGVQEKRIVVEWRGSTRSRGDPRPQIQFRPLNWRYRATPRSAMRARASG